MNEVWPQSAAATDWVARYEQLRKDVLTQAIGGSLGLILFLRQGMTAWMRTCACAPTPASRPAGKFVLPWLLKDCPLPAFQLHSGERIR